MPTKANNTQPGFFEALGRKADFGLNWVKRIIKRLSTTYNSLNSDYIERIHRGKILKILPPSLVLLALFLVMLPIFAAQIINNDKPLYDNQASAALAPTEPLIDGVITQEIFNEFDENDIKISSVSLLIGTHERVNRADYIFSLKKGSEVIYSEEFSTTFISDNNYHQFNFPSIQLEEDVNYSFSIEPLSANEDNSISLYRDNETNEIIYKLSRKSPYRSFITIASVVFFVLFCIFNILINSGKVKTEFHFLAYALIYIIPLVFIYPAYTIPDEQYHFLSTVRLAEYDFSDTVSENFSRTEVDLPANSGCLMMQYLRLHRLDGNEFAQCFSSAPNESGRYVSADNTTRALAYAPAALGVKIGDLISDSPMVIFYFGRVFNLIAVSVIIVYAISLIKKHRMILLAIIMIPMFLQQAASYSYDGLLNAFCLLIVAYGIRLLTMDVKLRARDVIFMAIALAFIGLIKPPYIAVAVPLLFVRAEKFGKHKWAKWLLLISLLVVSVLPYIIDSQIKLPEIESATTSGRGRSLASLFASPRASVKMVLRTLGLLGNFYITSMIGYFGWFYFPLDSILVAAYLIFLVAVVLSANEVKFSKVMRWILILASIAVIGSIFLAMYLSHTTPTALVIEGVQGRYFLPVLPLLMLAFTPRKQHINLPEITSYAFMNFITLCFIITLLLGFY